MQVTDNVHSKQLSLLTSDLERYGFIHVAMESPNAVDLGLLRGEYTDLYHRYVTLQPTHFKRNAVSAGLESGVMGGLAIAAAAAVLFGILVKISKWIADTFFGGSAGGGGGGASIKVLEKTIKDGELRSALQDLCTAMQKGKPVKPADEEAKKLTGKKAYLLSGKKTELLSGLVKKTVAASKDSVRHDAKSANIVKLFKDSAAKPDTDIKNNRDYKEYLAIQEEQLIRWDVPASAVSELKHFYDDANKVSCVGMDIATMSRNLAKAANILLDAEILPVLAYVFLMHEHIEIGKKRIKEIEEKGKDASAVENAELAFTRKATHICQKALQSVYELYKFASETLKEAAEWLAAHALKQTDAFDASELEDIKEKLAAVKNVDIGVKVRV